MNQKTWIAFWNLKIESPSTSSIDTLSVFEATDDKEEQPEGMELHNTNSISQEQTCRYENEKNMSEVVSARGQEV